MEDQTFDGHYEAEQYAYAAEAEAEQQQQFENYLGGLIQSGQFYKFALEVAIDELQNPAFKKLQVSAVEYLQRKLNDLNDRQSAERNKPEEIDHDNLKLPF